MAQLIELIESAKAEVSKQEKTLASTKKKTETQLSNAKAELETSKQEIQTAEAELVTKKEEFNTKIADAETELIDAKEKVNEIESAEWYILDRNQNSGYVSFIQDTQSVDSLSIVFPINLLYFFHSTTMFLPKNKYTSYLLIFYAKLSLYFFSPAISLI